MRRLLALLALLLVSGAASPPPATPAELRLVTGELPPYCFRVPPPTMSEAGTPRGLVYDVVRAVAFRIGHSGTVEFWPWERAQEMALTQKGVGILALTRSPEREDRYRWIFNVVTDDLVLVGGSGVDASRLENLKDRPIGVLQRSGAEALLRGMGFSRVQPATEEWINAQRMTDRLLDGWLAPRLMVLYAAREIGADVEQLNIGQVVRRSEIWFAGSKDVSDEEIAKWRDGFEAIKADGTYEQILNRYTRLKPEIVPEVARRTEIPWVN